jgi:hypothetical protein
MPGDRQSQVMSLGHHGAKLVEGELARDDVGARCHHAAAGHHLDDVDAAFGALTDCMPQTVRTGRLATHHRTVPAD